VRHTWPALAGVAIASLLLAGCTVRSVARPEPAPVAAPPGSVVYRIDRDASRIWLYLRADGPLARVGHTHVICATGLAGTIWLQPQPERSRLELQLPVDQLVVDDPAERAVAGAEFSEPLDDAARAGTREHMLGASQLDATHFPSIELHSQRVQVTPDGLMLDLAVHLRDHDATLTVPVQWQVQGDGLEASGETRFEQTALGLVPYTALFGALRVADTVRVHFHIVAQRAP
jgi:polyisoprenoid-binding protein YceI